MAAKLLLRVIVVEQVSGRRTGIGKSFADPDHPVAGRNLLLLLAFHHSVGIPGRTRQGITLQWSRGFIGLHRQYFTCGKFLWAGTYMDDVVDGAEPGMTFSMLHPAFSASRSLLLM